MKWGITNAHIAFMRNLIDSHYSPGFSWVNLKWIFERVFIIPVLGDMFLVIVHPRYLYWLTIGIFITVANLFISAGFSSV